MAQYKSGSLVTRTIGEMPLRVEDCDICHEDRPLSDDS
jgi:hypothetical protein